MSKTLVIYYSRKGENYVNGSIRSLAKGNTEIVAEYIADAVGADLFQVETVKQYSDSYMTCIDEAKKELQKHARPELQDMLTDISEYDNIVVASPCWWGTFPMALFTQLEALDFEGKNVFDVMTHEGSGLGSSERDLKKICKGAAIGKSLSIHGADAASSEATVTAWAKANLK